MRTFEAFKKFFEVPPVFFFFGKTTEILGKMNFLRKKISVDFFLPRNWNDSLFLYVNTLKS